jgi:hypothetical protein
MRSAASRTDATDPSLRKIVTLCDRAAKRLNPQEKGRPHRHVADRRVRDG